METDSSRHGSRTREASLVRVGPRVAAMVILGLGALFIGKLAEAIEEPRYTVLIREGNFEIRQYQPYLVAETIVEGDFAEVGDEGFRRLFAFISGENRKRQTIPMTAPVGQQASERISMTAPVHQQRQRDGWRISFVMPSDYSLETVPRPVDDRIQIKQAPGRLLAVVRYSGTWSRKRYEEQRELLAEFVREKGLDEVGEAIFARYNPPFTPWFLRRNEVLIPVRGNGTAYQPRDP